MCDLNTNHWSANNQTTDVAFELWNSSTVPCSISRESGENSLQSSAVRQSSSAVDGVELLTSNVDGSNNSVPRAVKKTST
jgi:hypothetical protein